MAKMPVATFVKNVRSYIGRPYSEIDCAELLYLASNKAICRGANSQWRNEIGEHGRISDGKPSDPYPAGNDRKSSQLQVGMAVFMHKAKDTAKYPDGQGDYSHVGVVTSVKPLRITNSSSVEGKVTDYTRIGTFCAWGYLKDIDYGKAAQAAEREQTDMADYKLKTKCALNIRKEPSIDSDRIGSYKAGTVLTADQKDGVWYHTAKGWIHGGYCTVLSQKLETPVPAETVAPSTDDHEIRIKALEEKVDMILQQLAKEVGDDE